MAQHRGVQGEWPTVRDPQNTSVLAPGIRQVTGRSFAGPLRPGIAGTVGARGGPVADRSRDSDLGMDRMKRAMDSIGQKYPEVDPTPPLVADRGPRRRE